MHGLGRDHLVTPIRGHAPAPDQIGARLPDLAGVEVQEAAVEQRRGQVLGFRRVPVQHGHRIAERPQRVVSPSGRQEDEAPLEQQDPPILGHGHGLGPVQEAQPVFGAALLGLPFGQDPQQPGGQGVVRLVHLPRVGLAPFFRPAQLAQPRADVTGTDRRAAGVAFPQAALTRLAGPVLGTGERVLGQG